MKVLPVVLLTLILCTTVMPLSSAESSDNMVLVDFGNGSYRWFDNLGGNTFDDVLNSSVDGDTATLVRTQHTSDCSWRLYTWNGSWNCLGVDLSVSCSGTIAFGYYPDGFAPVSTPEYKNSWTTLGGSSSASNVSVSHGQRSNTILPSVL